MLIRTATPADIESMVGMLEQLCAIEEDFTFDPIKQSTGVSMLIDSPAAVILVAEQEGRVVGMVSGQLTLSTAEGGFSLLVEDLFVSARMRGKGIGTALLQEVRTWGVLHGAGRLQLLADRTNRAALSFYERTGWHTTQLVCLRNTAR